MKTKAVLCLFLTALLVLSACQATPEKVVVSKNDGEFEANVTISADATNSPDATQDVNYNEIFSSTDGSVGFQFAIEETVTAANMPVLLVEPHFLTNEDAERMAYVLFGESGEFYDVLGDYPWTVDELEEAIGILEALLDADYYISVMGQTSQSDMEASRATLEKQIANLRELLPSAQESSEFSGFEFRSQLYYYYTAEEIAEMSESRLQSAIEDLHDGFVARVVSNQLSYRYDISTRHKSDYNYNDVWVQLWEPSSGLTLASNTYTKEYYHSLICSRGEPATQEQVEAVREQALELLNSLGLGEWYIASCESKTLSCGHTVVSV
ncbi:MAG: hypothetical protein LUH51_00660, partial [Firmicutes bacterium]|nr:hypothetical protein [Bacillota bacterium]